MRVLEPGHYYELDHLDGDKKSYLRFVGRSPHHHPEEGVWNQEVLRVLIDRVKLLDSERPWSGNAEILAHLRAALTLHETRALLRKVEKGELLPEELPVGEDGHFIVQEGPVNHYVVGVDPAQEGADRVAGCIIRSLGQAVRHAEGNPDPGTVETVLEVRGGSASVVGRTVHPAEPGSPVDVVEDEEPGSNWEQGYLSALHDVLLKVMARDRGTPDQGSIVARATELDIRNLIANSADRVPEGKIPLGCHPDTYRVQFLERVVSRSQSGVTLERLPDVTGGHLWRFMRRHYVGDPSTTFREALDHAARDEHKFI